LFILSGGVFKLELFLPEEYPMAAPKVLKLIIFNFFHLLSAIILVLTVIFLLCSLPRRNDYNYE
jgi:hypothetical protein